MKENGVVGYLKSLDIISDSPWYVQSLLFNANIDTSKIFNCSFNGLEMPSCIKDKVWAKKIKDVADCALPFILASQPIRRVLALRWGNVVVQVVNLYSDRNDQNTKLFNIFKGVCKLGVFAFGIRAGLILNGLYDISSSAVVLFSKKNKIEKTEEFLKMLKVSCECASLVSRNRFFLPLHFVNGFLFSEAALNLYQAWMSKRSSGESWDLKNEKTWKIAAKMLFGSIRLCQGLAMLKYFRENFPHTSISKDYWFFDKEVDILAAVEGPRKKCKFPGILKIMPHF